jgi:hypothetical protein
MPTRILCANKPGDRPAQSPTPPRHHTTPPLTPPGEAYLLFDQVRGAWDGKVVPGTNESLLEQVLLLLVFDGDVRRAAPPALLEYATQLYAGLRMAQGGAWSRE